MKLPLISVPIVEIPLEKTVRLFLKREDLVHPEISGNKYWKLFNNVNQYLEKLAPEKKIITFGGAYSNHIFTISAVGKIYKISTLGIIRGEELREKWKDNFTLKKASDNGMKFCFVSRADYRDKENLTKKLQEEFPDALIIPEGGSNELAVEGIQHMLTNDTKEFDYLCSAVGTGGTLAGISRSAAEKQKVLGFKVVEDSSLENQIFKWSGKKNFELISAGFGSYGKITDENIRFINDFNDKFGILLDPIYTGKMMQKLFEMIDDNYFESGSKILAFHTGGLQGIEGANAMLRNKKREEIRF
ncbi:1-aminocyclopropane-1-carboxylate deaminase/D-cysteine desulfhydrase [Halpernia frigidisoli]|uniref:1-aminocyclopropane-1-carboxylate deaminase n=1 Tax=Halpernia frigidisoli TaxID=1125876 RepID=A0A1I3FMB4_9FLAO|nr:pyridoxal-phosphate dependent enzyme [Halpernia frigidisoli]SFI12304.1 1-aminocyclopropane-1-carboxylate deaminase [Halpernia frigidisoli]